MGCSGLPAEDAQTLIRNVNYEVPSLRKLSTKYEQQISDLERTIELCKKQARNSLNEYNLGAKKLGIEVKLACVLSKNSNHLTIGLGQQHQTRTVGSVGVSSEKIERTLETSSSTDLGVRLLQDIFDFHFPKVKHLCSLSFHLHFIVGNFSEVDCLPILHYLLAKGNTTYYEYETGNVPERVEEFKLGFFFGIEDNLASEIDATTAVEDNTVSLGWKF